jgi:hypothetical protein
MSLPQPPPPPTQRLCWLKPTNRLIIFWNFWSLFDLVYSSYILKKFYYL